MAPKGSSVIQAMLRRLAQEEELELLATKYKREKATGSLDAAKPLEPKAAAY